MKIGHIFALPTEYDLPLGHIGNIRDKETETKLIAKYEVVEIEGEKKGRVIVTYGNKRRNQ
jgi:hypothetical protein